VIVAARAFALLFLVLGLAILVRSVMLGVHSSGLLIGAVFVAIGLIRLRAAGLWLPRSRRRS
jgi:hypothetical protein